MEANKVDLFILSKSSMFPNAQLPLLREMLIKASDEDWIKINAASFKNPTTALIMSFAAGTYGADRFYLGQPLLGIGKLFLTFFLVAWLVAVEITDTENWIVIVLGLCIIFVLLFWYFIDIFLVSKTAKEQNLNIILTILN